MIYEASTQDGWKTASVFQRYDIVDEQDNWEAARLLHAKREAARMVVGATDKETDNWADDLDPDPAAKYVAIRLAYTGLSSKRPDGETGRRTGLKIPRGESSVTVRFRLRAPF